MESFVAEPAAEEQAPVAEEPAESVVRGRRQEPVAEEEPASKTDTWSGRAIGS